MIVTWLGGTGGVVSTIMALDEGTQSEVLWALSSLCAQA